MFIDVIKTKTHSILSEAYDPKVSLYVFCCTEFFCRIQKPDYHPCTQFLYIPSLFELSVL